MSKVFDQILPLLVPIFRDVFDDDTLVVTEQTVAADVDGWDSLAHIRLIVSIEKAFKLRFSAGQIANLNNVGDMMLLIDSKSREV